MLDKSEFQISWILFLSFFYARGVVCLLDFVLFFVPLFFYIDIVVMFFVVSCLLVRLLANLQMKHNNM